MNFHLTYGELQGVIIAVVGSEIPRNSKLAQLLL